MKSRAQEGLKRWRKAPGATCGRRTAEDRAGGGRRKDGEKDGQGEERGHQRDRADGKAGRKS